MRTTHFWPILPKTTASGTPEKVGLGTRHFFLPWARLGLGWEARCVRVTGRAVMAYCLPDQAPPREPAQRAGPPERLGLGMWSLHPSSFRLWWWGTEMTSAISLKANSMVKNLTV
jgi:hypothetical protein